MKMKLSLSRAARPPGRYRRMRQISELERKVKFDWIELLLEGNGI